jgi:L-2-hydroxyglutarate oxidase LhgO
VPVEVVPIAGARAELIEMDQVDAIVVGAGVVGLVVARALARRGLDTVVLERGNCFGAETSSRNSEVIHAGLYYPSGSLKAGLCVRGRELLYAYCEQNSIAHQRCGKLIVATQAQQLGALNDIQVQARANGVTDLRLLDAAEIRLLEPRLDAIGGLLSPSTGIVDSHALMLSFQADLERAGGVVVLRSPVLAARRDGTRHIVQVGGAEPMQLATRFLVNAAGLWATQIAAGIESLEPRLVPRTYFAKGCYFALAGRSPFSRLIYPIPEPGGLGVHLTLDLAGQARFGPDVEWLSVEFADDFDYRVDPDRRGAFAAAIRRYWPDLPEGALQPAYSGVRPKLSGPGEATADFQLQGPAVHGVPGLLNLYGIESPGLTASLAIADESLSRLAL